MLIRERVDRVLRDQLGTGYEWASDTPILDGGLDLDSLDVVELIMRLEEEFFVRIPDDFCEALTGLTVDGLAEWLAPRLDSKPALFA